MSRTPFAPLFDRLVDDAAVFPPGLAPLDVAVREHLDRRTGPYAVHIGPLLVPAASAGELAAFAATDPRTAQAPLEVSLVVRPGSPARPLVDALASLRDDERVLVTAAELGWSPEWRQVLDAVVLHGLPFKLTGGLHHAVRGNHGGEPMHGLLNVLLATHEALGGTEAHDLAGILARHHAEVLVTAVSSLSTGDAEQVRESFTAYGCCGVLDPLTELEALGLITTEESHA